MTQIFSLGIGLSGADWTDGNAWQGGVAPVYANGDTGYITGYDNFLSVPTGEVCDYIEYGSSINFIYGAVYDNYGSITGVEPSGALYFNYGYIGVVSYGGYVSLNYADITYLYGSCYQNLGVINTMEYDPIYSGSPYLSINDNSVYYVNDTGASIDINNNYIDMLNGLVSNNYGTINQINSTGIVTTNYQGGSCLTAPNGSVYGNYGMVYNVAGVVTVNYGQGIVENGDNSGIWGGQAGYVGENQVGGIITINGGNNQGGIPSTVSVNYGEIYENYGNVTTNKSGGVIYRNGYNGTSPSAYVETNEAGAVIHRNEYGATVVYNSGEVHQKDGIITNNYTGALVYFSSYNATAIVDAISGVTYGVASDAFSYINPTIVKSGETYQNNEELLTGTLIPTTVLSGVTIVDY